MMVADVALRRRSIGQVEPLREAVVEWKCSIFDSIPVTRCASAADQPTGKQRLVRAPLSRGLSHAQPEGCM